MIIIAMLLCVTISAISLATDYRNKSIRYFGFLWFFLSLSCVKPFIEEVLLIYFSKYNNSGFYHLLVFFGILCSNISNNFTPYFFFIFALYRINTYEVNNPLLSRRSIALFTLILPVTSFIIIFIRILHHASDKVNFIIICIWAIPYCISGIFLLIHSYKNSQTQREKEQALLICYVTIPACVVVVITSFVLRALGIHNAWFINRWLTLCIFLFYIYLISRYGFLGVKLKIEKMALEGTIRAVMSGTSIFNHTIKNEVIKILISANNIKNSKDRYSPYSEEDLNVILNSALHLEAMSKKIKENTREVTLDLSVNDLDDIVESAIILVKPSVSRKKIDIIRSYEAPIILTCDKLHIQEVLVNVLQNAIEAIESDGKIEISLERTKRYYILSVKDTGVGIPRELLPYAMDPFFSTKKKDTNYGFGLSFCYSIMLKHGGGIDIKPNHEKGTIVSLKFPIKNSKRKLPLPLQFISRGW